MKDEKLQQNAHRYCNLVKEVKDARYKASQARTTQQTLEENLNKLRTEMRVHVGRNVPHKVCTVPGGMTLTITYVADADPNVLVFDTDGNEILP
jgi:hypothetical protein